MMFTYESHWASKLCNFRLLRVSYLKISISVLPKNILFLLNTDGKSPKLHHISIFLCTLLNHQLLSHVSSEITLGDNEINTKLIQERGGIWVLYMPLFWPFPNIGGRGKGFYSSVAQVRKLTVMTWAEQVTILLNIWELLKSQRKKYISKLYS